MAPRIHLPDASNRTRTFEMPLCPQCGDTLVAPEHSVHVSERRVRHVWMCEECGHAFQTSVELHLVAA